MAVVLGGMDLTDAQWIVSTLFSRSRSDGRERQWDTRDC